MLRLLAILALLALLLAVAAAIAADEVSVVVHLTDGRKLEGTLVSEDEKGIVLRMKVGAEVPIARADIKEIVRGGADTGTGTGTEAEAGAESATETLAIITLRDGAVIRGRATDKGEYWEVENDLGTIHVEKKQVRSMRLEKVERGGAVAAAGAQPAEERAEAHDLGLGFAVTRPGPAWQFADQPPDPLARVVMRRADPVVIFRAALGEPFPAAAVESADAAAQAQVLAALQKELKERYRAVRGLAVAPDRYKGVPVWRATYQADTRVFASKFTFREIHLQREEGRFVLQAYAPVDLERLAAPEMEAALQSFSWLGPVSDLGSELLHYGLGIRIGRPRPDWRIATRLFDAEAPLEVLPPDAVGSYRLEVAPAGSSSTPQAAADALEKSLGLKSRSFRRVARTERNLSGVPAVDLKYQDLEGAAKLQDVRRLIFVREQKLVQFVAAYPATEGGGGGANERAAIADALFDGIDALVEESPLAVYRRGARAVELRVAGEKKMEEAKDPAAAVELLSQAIDLAPNYGQAYLLRGKAYADTADFKRAMRDYDSAGDLLEDPALGRLVAAAQGEQAKRLVKEGDFVEARKLFLAAIRNDPGARTYKEELARATLELARTLGQQGKFEPAIDELREAERRFPDDTRYRREYVRLHLDWARKLTADGEPYKARSVLKRALRLDPENGSIKSQLERLEADIKKKEEGDPKKGGKKTK